jgi:hypothetical protein
MKLYKDLTNTVWSVAEDGSQDFLIQDGWVSINQDQAQQIFLNSTPPEGFEITKPSIPISVDPSVYANTITDAENFESIPVSDQTIE